MTTTIRDELRYLLEARMSLLWVVTDEEQRAERAIAEVAASVGFRTITWDCAGGARDVRGNPVALKMPSEDGGGAVATNLPPGMPEAAFAAVRARERAELWVLRDLHALLDQPSTVRDLRNLAHELQVDTRVEQLGAVVVVAPVGDVPVELRAAATVLDWPLPGRDEIRTILDGALEATGAEVNGAADDIIEAAAGLSADDAGSAFARSIVEHRAVDPAVVAQYKKRIIERERVLAWWPPDPRGLGAIGGLDNLKAWLTSRRAALDPGAREYGLQAPRGVLLAGVPGCGKSTAAKAIPAAWGDLPLLRLDMGALKGSLVGQSEENIRRALRLADAMGRVVLWIDEVGKALQGAIGGDTSGVSADALGELLFWMQEHEGQSLVVATTNETDLPPEFCRRFDATFFVDLPTPTERAAILAVTLRHVERDPDDYDLGAVVDHSVAFSGDEVAKLVQAALLAAWCDGRREPTTGDLVQAAEATVPMARSAAEKIKRLREWAKGRALAASVPDDEEEGPLAAPDDAGGRFSHLRGGAS